ncbi:hypothetical protein SSS_10367, partial [Sarcoptes scabiei]
IRILNNSNPKTFFEFEYNFLDFQTFNSHYDNLSCFQSIILLILDALWKYVWNKMGLIPTFKKFCKKFIFLAEKIRCEIAGWKPSFLSFQLYCFKLEFYQRKSYD